MRDWIARKRAAKPGDSLRSARAVRPTLVVLCAALGGCSSLTVETPLLVTDPGKFQYHSCDQLNEAARGTSARVKELQDLMAKADQGLAGPLVSTVAYRSAYIASNEDLRLLEETARAKNCLTPATWQSNNVIR
jgi:hypothetical protein